MSDVYLGWNEHNPKRTPTQRAHAAIEHFVTTQRQRPQEIHCHPTAAVEIGPELHGIRVVGDGANHNLYLVGPVLDGSPS